MPLSRSQQARNTHRHSVITTKKETSQLLNELDSICDKHKVGNLTFKSCKLATSEGDISLINHTSLKGNMRAGVLLIQISSIEPSTEIYDLVKIMKDKIDRDVEKYQQENSKDIPGEAIPEAIPEATEKHKEILSKLNQDPRSQINEQPANNAEIKRNKFYRNFMKDIKSKFNLSHQQQFKYLEVRVNTEDMVIENTIVYSITIPKETYMLVVGDLQVKSGLIRRIDPSYNIESVIEEQTEFMERIREKEANAENIEKKTV